MDKYLIDGHKLIWHLDRVLEWEERRVIAPVYVEVSPVSYCNHKCIFCGIDFAKKKGVQLDTEMFCKSLAEMGKANIKSIMFAGEGEPLLHKSMPRFVKVAKDNGIDVSLTTNGSMENCKSWDEILTYLTWIRFSVDAGSSETYCKVHGIQEGLFDKTIKNIKKAVEIKKEHNLDVTVGVQFLIMQENLHDIENAISLFHKIEVDYISLKPYSLHPQMINKMDVIYTKETIERIQRIVDEYQPKMDIIFRKDTMERYMDKEKNIDHCFALPFGGYLSSNGDFYTCSVFIGDDRFKVGNIYKEGMESIIYGDARRESIEYGENKLCVDKECRLNCRMTRVNEFLELLREKPEHINFI